MGLLSLLVLVLLLRRPSRPPPSTPLSPPPALDPQDLLQRLRDEQQEFQRGLAEEYAGFGKRLLDELIDANDKEAAKRTQALIDSFGHLIEPQSEPPPALIPVARPDLGTTRLSLRRSSPTRSGSPASLSAAPPALAAPLAATLRPPIDHHTVHLPLPGGEPVIEVYRLTTIKQARDKLSLSDALVRTVPDLLVLYNNLDGHDGAVLKDCPVGDIIPYDTTRRILNTHLVPDPTEAHPDQAFPLLCPRPGPDYTVREFHEQLARRRLTPAPSHFRH